MTWITVALAASPPCVPVDQLPAGLTGQQLNVAGMHCYDRDDMGTAAAIFRKAVQVQPDHAIAHFNLACVLSRLRAAKQVCEHDAYQGVVLNHLEKSVALDERRRERARKDTDLVSVHHTIRYAVLTGTDLQQTDQLSRVLPGFTLYGPAPGMMHLYSIALNAEGVAIRTAVDFDDDGAVRHIPTTGTWKVTGPAELTLRFGDTPRAYQVHPDGRFTPKEQGDTLRDGPDECSA